MHNVLDTEQVAVLKGHSGLVKGVTWDPVGKYLASQVSKQLLLELNLATTWYMQLYTDKCIPGGGDSSVVRAPDS